MFATPLGADPRGQYYPERPMQAVDPVFTTRLNMPSPGPGPVSPSRGMPEGLPQGAMAHGAPQGMVPQAMPAQRGGMFANPASVLGPDGMAGINQSLQQNAALGQQRKERRQHGREQAGMIISNAIYGWLAAGGNPAGLEGLRANHEMMMARSQEAARMAQQQAELEAKRLAPTQVGDSLVQIDPATGQYSTLFRDPQPFEAYAASLGLQPGTPEYMDEVKNYRLGAWNDDAVAAKAGLEGVRFGYRDTLQDHRYDHMGDLQDDRLAVTRRGQDLTHRDRVAGHAVSRDNSIRSNATTRGSASYSHAPRRSSAAPVRVSSIEEARKLAPGTVFLTPDGKTKVR
jgi:hypothetical protein